jgi:hypothetical protein
LLTKRLATDAYCAPYPAEPCTKTIGSGSSPVWPAAAGVLAASRATVAINPASGVVATQALRRRGSLEDPRMVISLLVNGLEALLVRGP